MKLWYTKVTYKAVSGLPRDAVSSSFSAISTIDGATNAAIGDALANAFVGQFLNTAHAGGTALAALLGPSLSRTANDVTVQVYGPLSGAQLGGAQKGFPETYMGSPVYTEFGTIGAPAGSREIPRQSALDVVLRATGWEVAPIEAPDGTDVELKVDRPRQRLTGRIKVGPFTDQVNAIGPSSESRPTATLVNALTTGIDAMRDELWANPSAIQLAVWSRQNLSMVAVTDVQVPNAWSTVRRRKPDVTARNLVAID